MKISELFTEAKQSSFAPWQPTSPEATKEVLHKFYLEHYGNKYLPSELLLLKNGSVSVRGEQFFTIREVGPVDNGEVGILIKYNNIGASNRAYLKDMNAGKLTTLEGGPTKFRGGLQIELSQITSFKGFVCEMREGLILHECFKLKEWGQGCQITCRALVIDYEFDYELFRTIGQHLKIVSNITLYPNAAKTLVGKGLLSLFKVKKPTANMFGIQLYFSDKSSVNKELVQATEIVNKYLASRAPDIIACQRELIENDLDEYAEF